MWRSVAASLAVVVASARTGVAQPAPGAPAVNPRQLQREDAQRLREIQRSIERAQPTQAAALAPAPGSGSARPTGALLISIASVTTIASIVAMTGAPESAPDQAERGSKTAAIALLVASTGVALVGITLISRPVSKVAIAPALSPGGGVGLAVVGRL